MPDCSLCTNNIRTIGWVFGNLPMKLTEVSDSDHLRFWVLSDDDSRDEFSFSLFQVF